MREGVMVVGFISIIIALFVRAGWWQIYPGLIPCAVFWGLMALWNVAFIMSRGSLWSSCCAALAALGGALNGAVTIANGGFMPIVGGDTWDSIWVPATTEHSLLMLADHQDYWGASIGDGLIVVGVGGALAGLILQIVIQWIGQIAAARTALVFLLAVLVGGCAGVNESAFQASDTKEKVAYDVTRIEQRPDPVRMQVTVVTKLKCYTKLSGPIQEGESAYTDCYSVGNPQVFTQPGWLVTLMQPAIIAAGL